MQQHSVATLQRSAKTKQLERSSPSPRSAGPWFSVHPVSPSLFFFAWSILFPSRTSQTPSSPLSSDSSICISSSAERERMPEPSTTPAFAEDSATSSLRFAGKKSRGISPSKRVPRSGSFVPGSPRRITLTCRHLIFRAGDGRAGHCRLTSVL